MNTPPAQTPSPGASTGAHADPLPVVSIVFLAYNRREAVTTSLRQMLDESGYPADRLEVIVVDNASTDDTAEVVARDFPQVRLIRNPENAGAPGWNLGFAEAGGDYILILDDDCYLRPGVLETAVRAAEEEGAGLVSFSIISTFDEGLRFNDVYDTGLLSYWGCAALLSAPALRAVQGYDPDIFIWANEVDLTMRLLDHGYRHLYLPDLEAIHMSKAVTSYEMRRYLVNARHHSYIAGKLMRPLDAGIVLANLLQNAAVHTLTEDRSAARAMKESLAGFAQGLRRRTPVRPEVSTTYRRHFHAFKSPWRWMRTPADRLRAKDDTETAERRARRFATFFEQRAAYYPTGRASLKL